MAAGTTVRGRLVRSVTRRSVTRSVLGSTAVVVVERVVETAVVVAGAAVATDRWGMWAGVSALVLLVAVSPLVEALEYLAQLWRRARRVAALRAAIETAGRAWPVAGVTGAQIRPTGRDGGAR